MTASRLLTKLLIVDFSKVIVLFLMSLSPLLAKEQILTAAEAKAHYTFEIAKQVTWPNDDRMEHFFVGIIGSDPELEKAFEDRKWTIVRGKPFKFEVLKNATFDPNLYSIIFITEKSRSLNSKIFSNADHTLIITDGKVEKDKQMISLITSFRKVNIEINRENLLLHRFDISINLLGLAGTKKDLTEQLREEEISLNRLLKEEKLKEENLKKTTQLLNEKNNLLKIAQQKLDDNAKILANDDFQMKFLSKQIEASKERVKKNQKDISQQQLLLEKSQLESTAKEKEIDKLQEGIEKNQSILENQEDRINAQNNVIENRDHTIGTQQGLLTVTLGVIAMFLIMIYALLRINILKNSANKKLEELNSKLYELATTDEMTTLFNRRHFIATAQSELLRQQRKKGQSVVVMIDIDHFKQVNDNYGHAAGDKVIVNVAKTLKDSSRTYDITGRLGGEEYAMMMVDCDLSVASEITQRLCKKIEQQEIAIDGHTITVTISVGLSALNEDDKTIEQVLSRADKALYKAKDQGRNRVVIAAE